MGGVDNVLVGMAVVLVPPPVNITKQFCVRGEQGKLILKVKSTYELSL